MAYTVSHGANTEPNENIQRGLLVGLPALALVLSFGAIAHHHANNNPSVSPKVIPVVSALSASNDSYSGHDSSGTKTGNNGQTGNTAAAKGASPAGSSNVASGAPISSGSNASGPGATGSGGTGSVGGMGGGPTGGGTTLPDCSIDQIAAVKCQVPACSPEVTLNPGQKAILGIDGACVVLN